MSSTRKKPPIPFLLPLFALTPTHPQKPYLHLTPKIPSWQPPKWLAQIIRLPSDRRSARNLGNSRTARNTAGRHSIIRHGAIEVLLPPAPPPTRLTFGLSCSPSAAR